MSAARWLGLALQASTAFTVLGLGLTATWQDAMYLLRRPKLLLRALLAMNIVMPIVAALMATTFSLPIEAKAALVALAVSPVPPVLYKKQIVAGGRREYVVGLLVAMSVLAIVLVPLTVVILDHAFGRAAVIGPVAVARIMLKTVLAPLLVGLMIRQWVPAAEKASGAVIAVAGTLLVLAAPIVLYALWPTTRMYLANGVALMLAALAAIGLGVGHLFGGPLPSDRTALALSTASRHPGIALAIAMSGTVIELKLKPVLAIILLYLVVAAIVSFIYQKWRAHAAGAVPRVEAGRGVSP
jgi:BASS family bile acid:Na+ symporter